MERKKNEKTKEESPADIDPVIYHYGMYSACYFCTDIAGEIKDKYIREYEQQAEADLQKANQSLNMTLDKYETVTFTITTDEEFLSIVVNANDSEEIPEAWMHII